VIHRTLRVGKSQTFKTVRAAMKTANWGDTVALDPGRYDSPISVKPGVIVTGGPIWGPGVEAAIVEES